jgi:hypothetical protein
MRPIADQKVTVAILGKKWVKSGVSIGNRADCRRGKNK